MSEHPTDRERPGRPESGVPGPTAAGPDDTTVVIDPVGLQPDTSTDQVDPSDEPAAADQRTGSGKTSDDVTVVLDPTEVAPAGTDDTTDAGTGSDDAEVEPSDGVAGPHDVTVVLDPADLPAAVATGPDRSEPGEPVTTEPDPLVPGAAEQVEPVPSVAGPGDVTVLMAPLEVAAALNRGAEEVAGPVPAEAPGAAPADQVETAAGAQTVPAPGTVGEAESPAQPGVADPNGSADPPDPAELREPAELPEPVELPEPAEPPEPAELPEPAPTPGPALRPEQVAPVERAAALDDEPAKPWFHLAQPAAPEPDSPVLPATGRRAELDPRPEPGAEPVAEPARGPIEPGPPVERARSRLFASMRPRANRGQLLAALLCAGLGFGLVAQVRATQSVELAQLRQSDLVRLLQQVNDESEKLAGEEAAARAARDKLVDSETSGREAEAQARERLRVLGVLAGTVAASGPGIRLVVTDPNGEVDAATLLDILQELRDAGAEAVQIGSVRVVASTAFEDVGGGVRIGTATVRTPYTYLVIGDPDTLDAAMRIPGGVLDVLEQKGGTGTVTQLDRVDITALHRLPTPQYARPAPDGAS